MSGANFLENKEDNNYLCWASYDKIHQLIRDNKNGLKKTAGYDEIQAQSSYTWSINYKPFNSGQWGKQKGEMLEWFLLHHDTHSAIFEKYMHLIAAEFEMDFDGSDAAKDSAWAKLSELKSFFNKGCLLIKHVTNICPAVGDRLMTDHNMS